MTHVCICGLEDREHDHECYASGQERCWHSLPLCCPNCPCLSYEDAHPELFGTLIGSRLTTRVLNLVHRRGVFTMERLESERYTVMVMHGIGRKARWEILTAIQQWKAQIEDGAVVRRPLPESEEFEQVLEDQRWPYRNTAA